jgi:Fur family transcriptional regulator, zinc uptake regulator
MMTEHNHERSTEQAMTQAEKICEARRQRLTPLRKQVLRLILENRKPIGAYQVLEKLSVGEKRSAPPTVYRAIEFLLAQGLVHRIASLNAFIACHHPESAHLPQFLICQTCQRTEEMCDKRINGLIYQRANKVGFNPSQQILEVQGLCASCQAVAAVSAEKEADAAIA